MEDNAHRRQRLRGMSKKQVVNEAGYPNIKALCKNNPDIVNQGKAPSKNAIISAMM